MHELSSFLKTYMDERDLTLREMEQLSKVSKSVLNSIVKGKEQELRLSTLQGIARAVKLPLWRIIELAGVNLELSDTLSVEAERLLLKAKESEVFYKILTRLLYTDQAKLYNILEYLDSPYDHQVRNIQISFIHERHQELIAKMMELTPKLLADVPRRTNIYEGIRINRDGERGSHAFVAVNGQDITKVLHWNVDLEWGYPGTGPSNLAKAILTYEYGHDILTECIVDFIETVTIALPRRHSQLGVIWQLESQQLDLWLMLMRLRANTQTPANKRP